MLDIQDILGCTWIIVVQIAWLKFGCGVKFPLVTLKVSELPLVIVSLHFAVSKKCRWDMNYETIQILTSTLKICARSSVKSIRAFANATIIWI